MKAHRIFLLIGLGVLAALLPAQGMAAQVTAAGNASLTWDSTSFAATLNWTTPDGDTRGSFSGVSLGLNGPADPYGPVDYRDGAPWGNTAASQALTAPNGSVTAAASTNVPPAGLTTQQASGSMTLNNFGAATIAVSQAVLSGQFLITAPTTITIAGTYHIDLALLSNLLAISHGRINGSVGWTIQSALDDSVVASAEKFIERVLDNQGEVTFVEDAPLELTYTLLPGDYFFESQASLAGDISAEPVPEPATLILLGSGILGLVRARRKIFG